MMKRAISRCTRCVLPDATPNIYFDNQGICNYCKSYEKYKYRGEDELLSIFKNHRNVRKKYECIVNISGGRDSAYTLLKSVKDYGMKTLALNYENPFTDNQAKENIVNMVKKLNVDLISFKHKSNIHESCFRNNLLAWFKHPSPAMVPMMCIGCKIIWPKIISIAKAYDISLIINGGNPFEYTSYKKELLDVESNKDLKTTYSSYIKGLIRETFSNISYLKPQYIPTLVKGYLYNNQYSIGSRLQGHNISRIDLFHFIEWNEKEIISRITNECDWDYPHKLESTWRFDCTIGHLKDYMYIKTLGITEKDDFYAKLVREGMISREEALKRLEKENQIQWDYIYTLLTQVKISVKNLATL